VILHEAIHQGVQEPHVIDVLALGRIGPLRFAIVPVAFVALRIDGDETMLIRKEIEVIPKTGARPFPVPIELCSAMTSAGCVAALAGKYAVQVRLRPPCSSAPRSIVPGSFGIGGSERRNAQNASTAKTAATVAIDKNAIFRNLRMLTSRVRASCR
jgi:hypothetical protein